MIVRVASWNLFHGRALPAVRRDLLEDYAGALAAADWDVCGLQEAPPWWTVPLARACGASARSVRTSLLRGALPVAQRAISAPDPERLGVRGAAVNVLLVRPSAGVIVEHRTAALRRAPQRRTVHGVRIEATAGGGGRGGSGAGGGRSASYWVGNVHTHNRPEAAAARDLGLALGHLRGWADAAPAGDAGDPLQGGPPAILLGDLNVPREVAAVAAAEHGFRWLAGHRVDHVLGTAGTARGEHPLALRPRTVDRSAGLSDHRLVITPVQLGN